MNYHPFDRFSIRPAANRIDSSRSQDGWLESDLRQSRTLPASALEQDAAYLPAIEAGDFETVLRLIRKAARKADMIAQAAWLFDRAIAEGYDSLDELVRINSERFVALGIEWRQAHPARF